MILRHSLLLFNPTWGHPTSNIETFQVLFGGRKKKRGDIFLILSKLSWRTQTNTREQLFKSFPIIQFFSFINPTYYSVITYPIDITKFSWTHFHSKCLSHYHMNLLNLLKFEEIGNSLNEVNVRSVILEQQSPKKKIRYYSVLQRVEALTLGLITYHIYQVDVSKKFSE